MRCPECNTETGNDKRYCPNCGAPMPQRSSNEQDDGEPRLSRGMVVFIIAGLVFLIVFGTVNYIIHSGEPGYVHTIIEPDTNLAEKNAPKFDTLVVDTAKQDSIRKAERREAEKLLNSIRHRKTEETEQEEVVEPETGSEGQTATESETTVPAPQESQATPSKPSIETIETE